MPLVRLLEQVEERVAHGNSGDVVKVDGPTAQLLVTEGRAVLVREQPHETASK